MAGVEARFVGPWRITSMEQWDREYMDLVAPAHITFAQGGRGEFQFGTVRGSLDCRFEERDGTARVDFSWEGDSEGDPACGRGWAEVRPGGALEGCLYFHMGDVSVFTARRRRTSAAPRKPPEEEPLVYWTSRPRKRNKR